MEVKGSAGIHPYHNPNAVPFEFRARHDLLLWKRRVDLILKEVLGHKPDVVCLQEVRDTQMAMPNLHHLYGMCMQVDHFDEIETALKKEGFAGVFHMKAGGPRVKDGSAIFWRTARFQLSEWQGVPLKENIMTAVMVRLLPAHALHGDKTQPLVVCSTHLKAGFNNPAEHVRHKQTMELLAQLDAFAKA